MGEVPRPVAAGFNLKLIIAAGSDRLSGRVEGTVAAVRPGQPQGRAVLLREILDAANIVAWLVKRTGAGERGDIGIAIVGLNKGEQLYEALLIGNNPEGTDHARIMTAPEVRLPRDVLLEIPARLRRACQVRDIADIQRVFLEAPLAYQPNGTDLHDILWNQVRQRGEGGAPRPQVVATRVSYPSELDRMPRGRVPGRTAARARGASGAPRLAGCPGPLRGPCKGTTRHTRGKPLIRRCKTLGRKALGGSVR